jgi:hypothetical protein
MKMLYIVARTADMVAKANEIRVIFAEAANSTGSSTER